MDRKNERHVMESVFSTKMTFQSSYPEKYKYLDYNTQLSDGDIDHIKKVFSFDTPEYIEDMKRQGMNDKYRDVISRYVINTVRKKYQDELDSFNKLRSDKSIKNRVRDIGTRVYHDARRHVSGHV